MSNTIEDRVSNQVPRIFQDSHKSPYFALKPLERMGEMQLDPRAVADAVRPQIRRGLAGVRPGKGARRGLGFARGPFGTELGVEERQRRWMAAPGGGRRGSSCFGEPPAREGQWAVRVALRWSMKGVAKHWPAGCGLDGGAPHSRDGGLAACTKMAGRGLFYWWGGRTCLHRDGTPQS
jgi:hypothetical protein